MTNLSFRKRDSNESLNRLRRNGEIPGVLFGPNIDSKLISMPESTLSRFVSGKGAVYEITNKNNIKRFVMFDEVQREPASDKLLHFSLKVLPKGQENIVSVPLRFTMPEQMAGDKGLFVTMMDRVNVISVPSKVPPEIKVDLSILDLGQSLIVADLAKRTGFDFEDDSEQVIAQYQFISAPILDDEVDSSNVVTEVIGDEMPIITSQ